MTQHSSHEPAQDGREHRTPQRAPALKRQPHEAKKRNTQHRNRSRLRTRGRGEKLGNTPRDPPLPEGPSIQRDQQGYYVAHQDHQEQSGRRAARNNKHYISNTRVRKAPSFGVKGATRWLPRNPPTPRETVRIKETRQLRRITLIANTHA